MARVASVNDPDASLRATRDLGASEVIIMEPCDTGRTGYPTSTSVIKRVESARTSSIEASTASKATVTPSAIRTKPSTDMTYDEATIISPTDRTYMEADRLGVHEAAWKSSRRGSQNSHFTSTTSPSSVADSFVFRSNQDPCSIHCDRIELGHLRDASSPLYGPGQACTCGQETPLQQQQQAEFTFESSLSKGAVVEQAKGTTFSLMPVIDNTASDAFISSEQATMHVAPRESRYPARISHEDEMILLKNDPDMQKTVQYTNHGGDGIGEDNLLADPNKEQLQAANGENRAVQLNGGAYSLPTHKPLQIPDLEAPGTRRVRKKDLSPVYVPVRRTASGEGGQNQGRWQNDRDMPPPELKSPTSGDLKRVAADRSGFQTPKRIRAGGGGGPDEGNDVEDSDSNSQTWACPFFRNDPLGNMDCLKLKLKRIRDVKQHIQRRHNNSGNYCPRCLESFTNRKKREEHVNSGNCQVLEQSLSGSKGGISEEVQEKLKHRALRSKSGKQQWYDVYDIVFKGQVGPERNSLEPQLGTFIMETTRLMRSFWREENKDWFPEYLNRHPLVQNVNQEAIGALVLDLMGEIHTRFEQRIRGSSSPVRRESTVFTPQEPFSFSGDSSSSIIVSPTTETPTLAIPHMAHIGSHLQHEVAREPSLVYEVEEPFANFFESSFCNDEEYSNAFLEADDSLLPSFDMGEYQGS